MKHNVLITGVSGYLGQALVRRLIRDNPFGTIHGVDAGAPRLLGPVQYLPGDVARVDLGDLLVMNAIDTVLHLAYADAPERAEESVARRLLEAAGIVGLRRVVIASRDSVYRQTAADVGEPRDETAPIWSLSEHRPAGAALRARVEHLVAEAQDQLPEVEVVSLRFSHILGPRPGSPLDGFLELPWLPMPRGLDPVTHALHTDDAAELLMRAALRPDVRGPINAGAAEPLRLSEVAGVLEKPCLRAPAWLGRSAVEGFRALRLHRVPPADPARLRWSVPLVCDRMHTLLDYAPRYTTRQALAVWRTRYLGP